MRRIAMGVILLCLVAIGTSRTIDATNGGLFWREQARMSHVDSRETSFRRVGTFAGYRNNGTSGAEETVSEIIAATDDGRTLVYTDAVRGTIGFIDITDPGQPQPLGTVDVDPADIGASPTSVDVLGNRYALVAVNTSESFTTTSGKLMVVDIVSRSVVIEIALEGQPDSVKISPDRAFAAIVIENERNEDLCVGGTLTGTEVSEEACAAGGGLLGALPQTAYGNPPGFLAVLNSAAIHCRGPHLGS
jgi:hypothetical protein